MGCVGLREPLGERGIDSDVNKDLTFKAKDQDKDQTYKDKDQTPKDQDKVNYNQYIVKLINWRK